MILDKYSNIKTPRHILESIEKAKSRPSQNFRSIDFKQYDFQKQQQQNFLLDSLKYRNETGRKSNVIPFQSYSPTFDSLDPYRKQFYFYWRSEAVKGNFIETELSYIFLFSYELLNYGYHDSAAFNISMLELLYTHYIYRYPKLDRYLPNWMADFLIEAGEIELSAQWTSFDSAENKEYADLKNMERALNQISMNTWWRYIPSRSRSHFFAEQKQKIYMLFKFCISFLQKQYKLEDNENGIFEHLFPLREVLIEREFYQSAVICREVAKENMKVIRRTLDSSFCLFLAEVMRVSENALRERMNTEEHISINHEVLSQEWEEKLMNELKSMEKISRFTKVSQQGEQEMGSFIPQPPEEKIEVTFDFDLIHSLKEESAELQTIFEEKYGEEEIEEKVQEESKKIVSPLPVQDIQTLFSSHDASDEDTKDFVTSLSLFEKEFLSLFSDGYLSIEKAKVFLKTKGIMFGSFLIDLNEKAEEHLGDVLLEEENDRIEITEEFIFILEQL